MFALRLKETSGLAEGAKAELYPKGHRAVSSHPNSGRLNGKNWIVVGHRRCWRDLGNGNDSACFGPGDGASSSPALSVSAAKSVANL